MKPPPPLQALGLAALFVAGLVLVGPGPVHNPWLKHPGYVDPSSQAAQASRQAAPQDTSTLRALAEVPTAIWLTPEALPADQIGSRVAAVEGSAGRQNRTPTFVLYGIPERDCEGGHSGGGLDEEGYAAWVDAIAIALRAGTAIVLEPDALASAPACGVVESRVRMLSRAVDRLVHARAAVYVDAGHAEWLPAAQMAELLHQAGIERARGFALNVAGYGATADQDAYAKQLREALPEAHYVIDTGRNGNGPGETWCNPAGRALGERPRAFAGALDAWLWVKPPGESDGTCNGGPPAGAWWLAGALQLAGNAEPN